MTEARQPGEARRLAARFWRCPARRAVQMVCLWLVPLAGGAPGLAAQEPADPVILSAQFADPTDRYPHGVLGDKIEYGALALRLSDGRVLHYSLPRSLVFEDSAPRLVDLDHDGAPEVIVVESSLSRGARLSVWGAAGRITATPHIGQAYRWLAPVGAADLDGDGAIEIAYVDRPHLARTLRIWRYQHGRLHEVAEAPDVSNHQIGWPRIAGGIAECPGAAPRMIVADGAWQDVLALQLLPGGRVTRQRLGPYAGPESLTAAMRC
ncbi:FG-GAP repeat domain-containing protein [Pseudooceanicola spongiae]|uniref:FG-GAP repeat domain-containing protein n=1 Tax=Pseudooceanicola spongiae TaxID=2613965 RepID=UPI001D023934|nr:VCBS repeat-containing protein [Pseudooceanicola spongiae]